MSAHVYKKKGKFVLSESIQLYPLRKFIKKQILYKNIFHKASDGMCRLFAIADGYLKITRDLQMDSL